MSATWMLLNTAYAVYAISGMFKEMLKLRVVLLAATLLFMVYGATASVWSVFWWNIPVGLVQIFQIWALVKQRRRINLDDEADAIRILLFPSLDRTAFNLMWHAGVERIVGDEVLIVKGEPVTDLFLILDGEVDVRLDNNIVPLGKLRMLGEMSAVSGSTASATVAANGIVRLRSWDKTRLAAVGQKHPDIERAVLQAIGHELARKLS